MKYLLFLLFPALLSAQEHTHADGSTHAAHGDETASTDAKPGADHFTLYAESDKYELTLYYSELTAAQEAHMTLYVANVATNSPIDKAELKVSTTENPHRFLRCSSFHQGYTNFIRLFQLTRHTCSTYRSCTRSVPI
jgi:hypothetical protein